MCPYNDLLCICKRCEFNIGYPRCKKDRKPHRTDCPDFKVGHKLDFKMCDVERHPEL